MRSCGSAGGGMMDKARWLLTLGYAVMILGLWIIGANER